MRKVLLAALVGAAAMVGASDSAKALVCKYGYGCGGPVLFFSQGDTFTWDFNSPGSLYFWLSGPPYSFYVQSVDTTPGDSFKDFTSDVYPPGGIISYNSDSWAVTVTLEDAPCPTCTGAGIFEQGNNPPTPPGFETPIPGTLPLLASVLAAGFLFFRRNRWSRNDRSAVAAG
jgi:hypothetical protein